MGEQRRTDNRRSASSDDERRDRARQRLAEREARLNGHASPNRQALTPVAPSRQARFSGGAAPNPVLSLFGRAFESMRENPRRALIAVAAVAVLVLVFAVSSVIRGCAADGSTDPDPVVPNDAPVEQQAQRPTRQSEPLHR